MSTTNGTTSDFLDLNGRQVHAFASQVANVGYARLADLLEVMLDSGAWRKFADGLGGYQFLPGEFDYFLTQQGVRREDVMGGVRDLDTKARLEAAMDERRTGEDGYRRRLVEIRNANPQRPGRPIEPFGLTKSEAKALVDGRARGARLDRPALGERLRRFTNTGGATSKAPRDVRPLWERLRDQATRRLEDHDLADLVESLRIEQRRRRRAT